MRQPFLFEFEDQSWFPSVIREGMMDFLRFLFTIGNLYRPVIPLLANALQQSRCSQLVDLCSGSGGPIQQVHKLLARQGTDVNITLTDKFPNLPAYRLLQAESHGAIQHASYPVDAMQVPVQLVGFRTLFSGFHHFDTANATRILRNAVAANQGIAIFDGGDKSLRFYLAILLLQPAGFLLFTPFIRPFRWSRIFFTYLLPLIPLCTIWDGLVSTKRLYTTREMMEMAEATKSAHYCWRTGIVKNRVGIKIAYLIGYPTSALSL